MVARQRSLYRAGVVCLAAVVLVGCSRLPRALRQQIDAERSALQQTQRDIESSQKTVRDDLAHSPDLFKEAPVKTEWPARLDSAQATLGSARKDLEQLDQLTRNARSDGDTQRAERLLSEERELRRKAQTDAQSAAADANNWLDFERNQPHYLAAMQHEYDSIHAIDLAPVTAAVTRAEQDWPAKKSALDDRLSGLKRRIETDDEQWRNTAMARQDAAAGHASGAEIATLIQANNELQRESAKLPHDADDLRAASGQLYDSWDKVLSDLEVSNHGNEKTYAEKVTTVRTHYTDVAAKKTQVLSDTQWVDVPATTYHRFEKDLGMTIAHKDAGQFDSEATEQAQPPGFSYIASPEVGRNQYGYWSNTGGHSVWTWLPEYLILRELLWGHSYQPIYINEYNGYAAARRAGQTYYGRATPSSPPKYGSSGTVTTQRYAGSRYVQSGGYAGSAYATNNRSTGAVRTETPARVPGFGRVEEHDNGAGKQFGGSRSGQRFGTGGGLGAGTGQRFGTPRAAPPRLPGRRFGRR